ncbi:hypothetical protein PV08_11299 [Exophiala spinifera]|uniref:Uncharacterized protein n=1 Tax=Exophiala spinifera TaxID=91928 RepID=A0A0D1ZBC4_9EURO|nr:uncharacterized protein PV08_11299 [Exophiala spinifera]KIW10337.1 hypothetical protein PV08_11299 [Exophiala spinifera]
MLLVFMLLWIVFFASMMTVTDVANGIPNDASESCSVKCQQEHEDTKHCVIMCIIHQNQGVGFFLAATVCLGVFKAIDSKLGRVAKTPPSGVNVNKKGTEDYNLHDLIDAVCTRKATNPKDKAFGLYPILEELLHQKLPVPDYSLPTGQLYRAWPGFHHCRLRMSATAVLHSKFHCQP